MAASHVRFYYICILWNNKRCVLSTNWLCIVFVISTLFYNRQRIELISVMKFVFLTFTMEGVTGGPSYINNKVKWLKEQGWEVIVFDHYGSLNVKSKIVLENLKPYCTNRFLELFFPPKYFSKKQRERIINMLVETIGKSDDYVIETNTPRMALWGELLAKKLGYLTPTYNNSICFSNVLVG